MIEIKNYEKSYDQNIQSLVRRQYEEEQVWCKGELPQFLEEEWYDCFSYIKKKNIGKLALEDGTLVGFLLFDQPYEDSLGKVKGVYSPFGCNAFLGSNPSKTASLLFQETAKELIKDGVCGYAISYYAHEKDAAQSLILNGFGIRCSDAILNFATYKTEIPTNTEFLCTELTGKERRKIHELRCQLVRHLADAPVFLYTDIAYFNKWYEDENKRVFVIKDQEELIGFMAISDDAETYMTRHPKMVSICGMYVKKEYREKKVAKKLLDYVVAICKEEGFEYLGVDCETLNPTALRFWGKYFTNYTYSYHRRIDERCIGYLDFLEKEWG